MIPSDYSSSHCPPNNACVRVYVLWRDKTRRKHVKSGNSHRGILSMDDDVHVILYYLYLLVNCPVHCQVRSAASQKKVTNSFWLHKAHMCPEWVMTCGLLCHHFLALFMPADLWVQVEGVRMHPPILRGFPIFRKINVLIIVLHAWLTLCWNILNNDEFWAGRTRPTRVLLLKYVIIAASQC